MHRIKLRVTAIAAFCLLLVAAVAGCGGGGSSSSAGGSGGVFRIGGAGASIFDSANPFAAQSFDSFSAYHYIYPYLVQYNENLELTREFATDWSSPDGKTWTFNTQPDAKWSDGKPLTAKDVAWTLNTLIKYQTGVTAVFAQYTGGIVSASAPSDDQLEIKLDERVSESAFLARLQGIPILPEHVWSEQATGEGGEGLKKFANTPPMVAGGPFVLTKFTERNNALFERNPHWYGPEPHIEAWGIQHYSSADAQVQALQANEIDLALRLPPTSVKAVENAPGLEVQEEEGFSWASIGFNSNPKKTENPEIRDPKVRLAFAYALDNEKLIDTFLLGAGTPGISIIPPNDGRWFNQELEPIPYDPSKANELLDELGFKKGSDGIRVANGEEMSYELIYLDSANNRLVELIQANMEAVGIEIVPKIVGDAAYVPAVEEDDYTKYDMAMDLWGAKPDPDTILSTLTCLNLDAFTETVYCNEKYDELYERQGHAKNDDERQQIVWEMQDLLVEDRPYEVLFYLNAVEGLSDKWTGLVFTGNGSFNEFSNESLLNVRLTD